MAGGTCSICIRPPSEATQKMLAVNPDLVGTACCSALGKDSIINYYTDALSK